MQAPWLQNYDPLHNPFFSTLLAAVPVVVLLGSIAVLKIRIHFSALLGLGLALLIALAVYGMPWKAATATALYGAAYGLFPIGWIILNLIFLYHLTLKTGLFDVFRNSLSPLSSPLPCRSFSFPSSMARGSWTSSPPFAPSLPPLCCSNFGNRRPFGRILTQFHLSRAALPLPPPPINDQAQPASAPPGP